MIKKVQLENTLCEPNAYEIYDNYTDTLPSTKLSINSTIAD